MPGVVTPLHFDEAYNFFTQVKGRKLFKLYSPKYFPNVYPYPVHHFHDRQCQSKKKKYLDNLSMN